IVCTLASAACVFRRTMLDVVPGAGATATDRIAAAMAHRDFIYVVVALAALGHVDWFLLLAAAGSPVFLLLLLWVAVARRLACALLLIGGAVLRRRAGAGWLLQLVAVAGLVLAAAWTSHAAARVGPRALLLALDALHQLAAGVWIGGLAQLLVLAWG